MHDQCKSHLVEDFDQRDNTSSHQSLISEKEDIINVHTQGYMYMYVNLCICSYVNTNSAYT